MIVLRGIWVRVYAYTSFSFLMHVFLIFVFILDDGMVQRRRTLFWELTTCESLVV
jgi:hypothetical protein